MKTAWSRWASHVVRASFLMTALGCPSAATATNVRPFVDAGYTRAIEFEEYEDGYGFGGGLEFEQSHRMSALVQIDWNELIQRYRIDGPYGYLAEYRTTRLTTSCSIGARLHVLRRGRVRPYIEGRWGVRMHQGDPLPYLTVADVEPSFPAMADGAYGRLPFKVAGPIGALGFGITTARFHNAGVNFGVTIEGLLHEIDHFGLATARLGIVFP